jgi:Tfp pilus assembly protein PilF
MTRHRWQIALLLLLAAGLAAYHNSFRVPFLFDDHTSIVENTRIRQLWRPGDIIANTSRPVVQLTLALNYAVSGLQPWSYHALNLAVHIAAALTLYGILARTGAGTVALPVAVLWLVHPLQTQAVTYVIQRAESLMGLLYLLTLYCFIRGWHGAAVVACALGMATKPVMATAPVAVLLVDRVFVAGSVREALRLRWRLYTGLAGTWVVLAVVLANGAREWQPDAGFGFKAVTTWQYLRTQPQVILHYLRLAVWPRPLCLDYGWPVATAARQWLPPAIVVGGLVAVTVWAWRRKPALGFPGAFFFLVLAPSSSVIPIRDLAFEHRMYLPLAAVMTVVVLGLSKVRGWPVLVACAAIALGAVTVRRNAVYGDELAIWRDTVGKRPQHARNQYNFGVALYRAGNVAGAIDRFREAIRLKPDYADAHYSLAVALAKQQQYWQALPHYERALELRPGNAAWHGPAAVAHFYVGVELQEQGRLGEAMRHYERALRLNPQHAEAHNNLGAALFSLGRIREAIAQFEAALRIRPEYADARNNLAAARASLSGAGQP